MVTHLCLSEHPLQLHTWMFLFPQFAQDNIAGKPQNVLLKLICIKLIPFRDSDIERHIGVTSVDLYLYDP